MFIAINNGVKLNMLSRFFKSLRIKQILGISLVGFLLLFSTACSNPDSNLVARDRTYSEQAQPREGVNYDNYSSNQRKQGGMNVYNDDPRDTDADVRSKTKELIDNAEASLQRDGDSDRYYNSVKGRAEREASSASKGLERSSENLKRSAEDATDAVQNRIREVSKDTKRAVKDTADNI
jgi:hypothetical protein